MSMMMLPLEAPPADGNLDPLPTPQSTDEEIGMNRSPDPVASHTFPIGIIQPPPGIKSIVEITARHVSRNGSEIEKTIIARNAKNPRFDFLSSSHPYHAFYQFKLNEYNTDSNCNDAAVVGKREAGVAKTDCQVPCKPLEAPEPEKYTVRVPEGITFEELDIIRLTAQFVSRNGRLFFEGLLSRESNNPLFHFMEPTHRLFAFFTALVDAYSDVLIPPKDFKEKLGKKNADDLTTVLERCLHRLEWDRSRDQQRKKEEDEKEQVNMIDWCDFAVVESIDYADGEDEGLPPPPMTLEEVIRTRKVSAIEEDEIVEPGMEVEMDMDEEEVKLVEEGMREVPMRIVKNWNRPEDRILTERDSTKVVVISPITGELIPIDEMSEHIRISLIDPKLKEQRDRMFAKIHETSLAQDDEIAKNIVGLARLRPDIFGTTEEEVSNAVKAEIAKKKEQVVWDGHTGRIGHTINQALAPNTSGEGQAALPPSRVCVSMHPQHQLSMSKPPEQPSMMMLTQPLQMQLGVHVQGPPGFQFAHLQVPRFYGQLLPPRVGMMQPTPMPGMPPLPSPEEAPTPLPEEPEPKRPKFNESSLVPEHQFLTQHPGSATVSVLNVNDGQVIEITVQTLSESVGSLKEKIAGEIQIPANKQKLSGKGGFLKDNMSLAHYNVGSGETLTLSLRERGGRKR